MSVYDLPKANCQLVEELDSNLLTQNPRFFPAGWEFSGGRFMYPRWEHWAGIKQLCPEKVVCCGVWERICFSWLLVQYFFGSSGNGERGNLWKWQRFCNHRKRYPIYKAYLQSDYKFVEYISWQPTPVSLSGESYGQRSLIGQSPRGCKKSDMTEHTFVHTYPDNAYNKTAAKGLYYSSILFMKSIVQLSIYIIAIFVCGICHTCEISNLVFKLWWVIIYRHNTWIFHLLREVMESATALRFSFSEIHLFSFLFWVLWTGFRGCSRLTEKVHACMLSCVWLFLTPWTGTCQAPLSMEFSRQEYWNGLPFSTSGYLPNPGIEPTSPVSPVLAGEFFTTEPPAKPNRGGDQGMSSVTCRSFFPSCPCVFRQKVTSLGGAATPWTGTCFVERGY